MTTQAPVHHSPGDWDYQPGATYEFDEDEFITPPTSIHHTSIAPLTVLSRVAGAQNICAGRIISWIRPTPWHLNGFTFRNQTALGGAAYVNAYLAYATGDNIVTLYSRLAGVNKGLGGWSTPFLTEQWWKVMLTWWTGKLPDCSNGLIVNVQLYFDDYWHDYGNLYDSDDLFADSGINRVGIFFWQNGGWQDNTAIYKEV